MYLQNINSKIVGAHIILHELYVPVQEYTVNYWEYHQEILTEKEFGNEMKVMFSGICWEIT